MDTIPEGFCQCGCGEKTNIAKKNHTVFGFVKGKPYHYIQNHHKRKKTQYLEEDRGFDTPCWIWQLTLNQDGYARTYRRGTTLAYKAYYERVHGPVPDGLQLDHLCCQRDCVNPYHLEAVTNIENTRRGKSTKLNPDKVRRIRELARTTNLTYEAIGKLFGISLSQVSRIILRQRWKDVP
jgi:hypothetical protein